MASVFYIALHTSLIVLAYRFPLIINLILAASVIIVSVLWYSRLSFFLFRIRALVSILLTLPIVAFAVLAMNSNIQYVALWVLYVAVIIFYLIFEFYVINYAPIKIDGEYKASYPSSHTLLAVTVMTSGASVFNLYVKKKAYRIAAYSVSCVVTVATVVGRLLAGVHWFTDIFASILLSAALIVLFYGGLELCSPINYPIGDDADSEEEPQ
jgi:membrane-associated phospholipid phosphatase